ncbi:MAG: multi-sensor hybrid histidine kinase [Verrucomicrobiales bacterium]|nr:multi-sensor hybrid histidine kinase [Verrucomicrobiales bacterium]
MNTTDDDYNNRVLIIDDTGPIHEDFRKILCGSDAGCTALDAANALLFNEAPREAPERSFQIHSAFQGREGFELVRQALTGGCPYALTFVDVRMPPGWDGIETILKIWEVDPDIQVVLCTAYSDYSWSEMIEKIGHTDRLVVLKKPFDPIEVQQLANALTEKWHLLQISKKRTDRLKAECKTLEAQFLQAQKMEVVGQLSGGIAHDFNNLLTIIMGYTQMGLAMNQLDDKAREAFKHVYGAAERAGHLTRQLLAFSRKQVMQPRNLDLIPLLSNMAHMLQRVLGEHISVQLPPSQPYPPIFADPGMLEQIVLNLAVNARDAMPAGGRLTLETELIEVSAHLPNILHRVRPGTYVCLKVTDTGSGIPPEILPRIFEPFFTTKEVGKGTGLGLATVYGIIEQHQGWVDVESQVDKGTTFRVFFPSSKTTASIPVVQAKPSQVKGGHETILLVEDEPGLRTMVRKVLLRYGYEVLEAMSGVEALQVWKTNRDRIHLLLTDMVMPEGLNGRDLAKKLCAENSKLQVIFTSGYSMDLAGKDFILREGIHFLPKPYQPQELAEIVRDTLDSAEKPPATPAKNCALSC